MRRRLKMAAGKPLAAARTVALSIGISSDVKGGGFG
jgi:hypothetical protein